MKHWFFAVALATAFLVGLAVSTEIGSGYVPFVMRRFAVDLTFYVAVAAAVVSFASKSSAKHCPWFYLAASSLAVNFGLILGSPALYRW